ncbi:hypothetical protein [Paracraurococcus ruber]|uniref:Rho-GAP domain-containing protein n=1 Tax=Paracraurococcus ruber TaxID=77675 RepID=A0ABS1CYS6_9PROT|nr:hypothetical protein [Paracraurococcus ruber]MBK1659448.1 hypothetical protein [Paracraurococcus ruber]TDG31162.1 hypothetical protein E2C05_11930 [Paracraurococcus ruber]
MEETTAEELRVLAIQAGMGDLPQQHLEELRLAWEHVRAMAARIPKDRPRGDEPAHVFVPTTFAREG